MLHVFVKDGGRLVWSKGAEAMFGPLPDTAAWLDLVNPAPDERHRAERLVGFHLPTREQMAEIEESSRIRVLPGRVHLTVMGLVWADTESPRITPVSFVLTPAHLVTLHHIDPQPFLAFRRRVSRDGLASATPVAVMGGIVEAMIERTAVVLRRVALELDTMGSRSLHGRTLRPRSEARDDTATLRRIGHNGHLVAKAHVSLSSLRRMLEFLAGGEGAGLGKDCRRWARGALLDVTGLDEYALFLTQKVGLLLDTTLGRINAEQNEIVKIVSVLSVALFPPTLVASVYGMNFLHMPERHWTFGYPYALLLMLLSALLPMLYFKHKRWL